MVSFCQGVIRPVHAKRHPIETSQADRSPPLITVIVHQMRHMGVCGLAFPVARPLLLRFGFVDLLHDRARILARRFDADAGQLPVHVLEARDGRVRPHGVELGLDRVVKTGIVDPYVLSGAVFLCAGDQDLVRFLHFRQNRVAVRPAVFEILDRETRGVGLALEVGEKGGLILDARDDWPMRVLSRKPSSFTGFGVWFEVDSWVPTQTLLQLFQVIFAHAQAQVIDDVLDGFGLALLLKIVDREGHVGFEIQAIARQLRLAVRDIGSGLALAFG